jgi:hypothetical protein
LHRDISPRNVRLTDRGTAKLIDFGAMVPMGPCAQVVGTPGFVAPEVVHQLSLDARTDLFSLGATLYFALTGQKPFAARTLAELDEAWRDEPIPPSQIVPAIPSALDALVLSLLRIDPAGRPGSAFEVMQRLTAIEAESSAEPEHIAHAYLSTPTLVGRELQQERFRQRLSSAMQGDGGTLIFEGEPGLGRSRFLDACVIEAKIAGATVLRVNGRAASATALAGAYAIAEQVLEKLLMCADSCAQKAQVAQALFVDRGAADTAFERLPRLRALEELASDRYAAQDNLSKWLRGVCEQAPLVIALDDLERIDQGTIAWLAALAQEVSSLRMLIVATLRGSTEPTTLPALRVLRSHASEMVLSPLSSEQTEALFASIFSDAPQVALVSNRIHRLAAGNLRESMALAHYMLERGLIRYTDGNWILPAELAISDLPASAEDAVRESIAELPTLPRRFAEAQALAAEEPWARADYAALAQQDEQDQVDDALAKLLGHGIVVSASEGDSYTLSHLGVRACLVAAMTQAECKARHLQLAQLCVRRQKSVLLEVQHRLLGGAEDEALDRLAWLFERTPEIAALFDMVADRRNLAAILERAQVTASARARPAREICELNRRLVELSITIDDTLYERHAHAWLAQLERDSGLCDYRLTSPLLTAVERIRLAAQKATARYHATAARDRVYPVDEAIRQLGYFGALSATVAARKNDTRLYASVPALLEPFSHLTPMLSALFETAAAAEQMNCRAQPEQAHTRMHAVYALLQQLPNDDVPYLKQFCTGVAQAIATLEVTLGYPSAEHWIEVMERDPRHRLGGLYLRRVLCIFDADTQGAARYRKQAELLAIQTDGYGSIPARLLLELSAHLHAADLTGVKHVADRTEPLAVKAPGWLGLHQLAQACFQRLRGDIPAAVEALDNTLALADPRCVDPPPHLNVWLLAAGEYVTCLTALGQLDEARAFGMAACELCAQHQLTGTDSLVRALALCEAKLGDCTTAAARLDAQIQQRSKVRPSLLAADYEARARVAIAAKDALAARRFVALATAHCAADDSRGRAKYGSLLDEARQAGLQFTMPESEFESAVLQGKAKAPRPVVSRHVIASVTELTEPGARAMRVLQLLTTAAGARAGHLYLLHHSVLLRAASLVANPDAALDEFASEYLQQQLELVAMTTVFTQPIDATETRQASWADHTGAVYRLNLLQCGRSHTCIGVIAHCEDKRIMLSPEYQALSKALSTRLLELGDAGCADKP